MKCCVVLAATVLSLALTRVSAMPPPHQCTPGIVEEIPLRMRKVCAALSTIYELSSAMESYLDDKGGVYSQSTEPELKPVFFPPIQLNEMRPDHDSYPLMENGVKRQDVDHVFLRFGRRR